MSHLKKSLILTTCFPSLKILKIEDKSNSCTLVYSAHVFFFFFNVFVLNPTPYYYRIIMPTSRSQLK